MLLRCGAGWKVYLSYELSCLRLLAVLLLCWLMRLLRNYLSLLFDRPVATYTLLHAGSKATTMCQRAPVLVGGLLSP